jgi:hypothetical protein
MAHFAQLDNNNTVLQVIVIDNNVTHDSDGVEQEELGIAFCKFLFGQDTNWVQTSFNSNMREIFAGIGDIYNAENNVFIAAGPRMEFTKTPPIAITKPTE